MHPHVLEHLDDYKPTWIVHQLAHLRRKILPHTLLFPFPLIWNAPPNPNNLEVKHFFFCSLNTNASWRPFMSHFRSFFLITWKIIKEWKSLSIWELKWNPCSEQLLLFSLFYFLIVHSLNDQLPKPVASPYLQFGVFCSVVVNYLLLTYCLKTQTFPYFLHCLVNFFFSFTFFSFLIF